MAVTRTLTAKSKGEVVGSIELNWPEDLDEAVAMEEGGERSRQTVNTNHLIFEQGEEKKAYSDADIS